MTPKVLAEGVLIFWFHSYDARYEDRASVHVGRVRKMTKMMLKFG